MNYKKFKKKIHGFTLIEMLIVLIIIWILTVFSLWISNDQIQKVRNKTVKEWVLAEWQSRYSRNLWSSSFSWIIYKHMDITLSKGENQIDIKYFTWINNEKAFLENSFTNRFVIKDIINWEYDIAKSEQNTIDSVTLEYSPYRIACKIKDWTDEKDKITLVLNVNDQEKADYCFEINNKNCRLLELPSSKCVETD